MRGKEPAFDGARLRAMRKQRGLSVHDVELRAGVSACHVWRLAAGKRPNVAAVALARIALAIGVDINDSVQVLSFTIVTLNAAECCRK